MLSQLDPVLQWATLLGSWAIGITAWLHADREERTARPPHQNPEMN